jgi:hypothetical protein
MLHDIPLADHILSVGKKLLPVPGEGLLQNGKKADGLGDMEEGGGGAACFDTVGEEGLGGLAAQGEVTVIGDKHTGVEVFSADEHFITGRPAEGVTIRSEGLIDIDGWGCTFFEGDFVFRHRDRRIRFTHTVYYII